MRDCPTCLDILAADGWTIRGACASVGIESKQPTDVVMRGYMLRRHRDEHHQETP